MKNIRWVSVADLHLDNSDPWGRMSDDQINSRVTDKLSALGSAVKYAVEKEVNFFVFLGDTFDSPRPLARMK